MIGASGIELLSLEAVQRSLVALLLAAATLPIVGVLIVGLDIIPVRFAIMHMALLGAALALVVGTDPMLSALVLCGMAGAVLAPLARTAPGLAGGIGLLMPTSIALALLVVSSSGVNSRGVFGLLWGSVLATRGVDLFVLGAVGLGVLTLCGSRRRQLALLMFDREIATCSGVAVDRLTSIVLVVVALAVGASIRLTGALLVDSVTLLPALAARNVAESFGAMVRWAIAFGLLGSAVGFAVALWIDQPPGPMLVLAGALIVVATYVWAGRR